ncbi:substrate-binding domain-containing protein [Microbacterium sp. ISL-59]|uniref:GntR family transcriptional regulator n=1 Tax=Microbacterium sp. ISL-59 TaxID=2819159 RepID=UPI001BE4EC6A|nr:substrate-binding domain-containing protein [Microbacterium sp. ISL-59]MBT2495738.1 substrate-binding domain-containing protein [Microbacterium sp. ISL-59]
MGAFPNTQPLFVSLAQQLRDRITAGEWSRGERLPPEATLAATHAVGINTVRRAVGMLVDDGVVVRRQGSGTYVSARWTGKTPLIGVIVPSRSYYFPTVVDGITEVARAAGATLRIVSSEYDDALEIRRIRELLAAGCDGLLITPTLHRTDPTARLDLLRALPIPVLLMERMPTDSPPDDGLSAVCTDVVAGGYAAVRHLARQGRRRIGFLGRRDTATADAALRGYRRAIDDLTLVDLPGAVTRRDSWDDAALADYAHRALSGGLDGVVCLGDREATALLPHLRRVGLSLPDDLALVAFDDEEAADASLPLTAVSPPKREIGRLAAATLLRQLGRGGDRTPVRMLLQPVVRERASTAVVSTRMAATACMIAPRVIG